MAGPAKLRRDAGVIGLLYASLGSIIGSGWLFGALHAAVQAGPLSVLSWVIGAVSILFLAFVFAELSTMFPNSGALVHMTHVSHGDLVGKIWSWILFLAFVSVPPVEVSAVLTYTNNYLPGLIHSGTGLMTNLGMALATVLLAAVVALGQILQHCLDQRRQWILLLALSAAAAEQPHQRPGPRPGALFPCARHAAARR